MKSNQKNITIALCLITFLTLIPLCFADSQKTIELSSMDLTKMTSGWANPVANKSVANNPLTLAGKVYDSGIGTHATSVMFIDLKGQAERFTAIAGIDDEVKNAPQASVIFQIIGDNKELFKSEVIKAPDKPIEINLCLKDIKTLILVVHPDKDGKDFDHADWADAKITYTGQTPQAVAPPKEEPFILTPPPGPKPKINGPLIYGARPGHNFIYRIPTTGTRPITFKASGLPKTLTLDKNTGIITGTTPKETSEYNITFNAQNNLGSAQKTFKLVVGDTLALTPPMGWNHWYTHYNFITDDLMREAAKTMVDSGMADFGYQYVNIDDCWMNADDKHWDNARKGPFRDENGNILCNKFFPDMYSLTEYIHSLGLKAGIYTSPGPLTCGSFAGAYQHEQQDVNQFAAWGFDFLKYDWCSYGQIAKDDSLEEMQKPYILMGDIVKKANRDIVLNLCQYGMGDVWKWGEKIGAQSWRTSGDLGFELTQYHNVARKNAEHKDYAHPGSWNDPDYLIIGKIERRTKSPEERQCPLTPNEQYSYMSLWCLMASPLFFSGDMGALDDFTVNILCNAEVLEIDQDPLGKQGFPVVINYENEIWKKELYDGSIAVGMFNCSEIAQEVTFNLKDLNLKGQYKVRDLWRQKDLGKIKDTFSEQIPRHGVILLRLYKK